MVDLSSGFGIRVDEFGWSLWFRISGFGVRVLDFVTVGRNRLLKTAGLRKN